MNSWLSRGFFAGVERGECQRFKRDPSTLDLTPTVIADYRICL